MSIHEGHRQRLKNRFRQEGLDHFAEEHVLELLLFYCISRQDTSPLAHRLLDRFGSLSGVLSAEAEELEQVEGIGRHVSTFLTLVMQTGRYYQVQQAKIGKIFRNIDDCGNFLISKFYGRENETVFLLCLDSKRKMINCKIVGEGSVNSANISVRRIVETALAARAATVVLAHNHPGGLAIPSAEDIAATHRVAAALEAVEIILEDHLVVAGNEFVSLVQSRYYTPGVGGCVR